MNKPEMWRLILSGGHATEWDRMPVPCTYLGHERQGLLRVEYGDIVPRAAQQPVAGQGEGK